MCEPENDEKSLDPSRTKMCQPTFGQPPKFMELSSASAMSLIGIPFDQARTNFAHLDGVFQDLFMSMSDEYKTPALFASVFKDTKFYFKTDNVIYVSHLSHENVSFTKADGTTVQGREYRLTVPNDGFIYPEAPSEASEVTRERHGTPNWSRLRKPFLRDQLPTIYRFGEAIFGSRFMTQIFFNDSVCRLDIKMRQRTSSNEIHQVLLSFEYDHPDGDFDEEWDDFDQ
jgi:hypothetical protein